MRRGATCSSSGAGTENHRRAPSGADPPRHDEPARQRDRGRRAAAHVPGGGGRRVRAVREGARTGEPRRADPRLGWRAVARASVAHGRRARRRARVGRRPVRRRASRRRGVGARCARHEGPVAAGAVALATLAHEAGAAAATSSSWPRPTRRWARISARVARPRAPGGRAFRVLDQRRRRRPRRLRRPDPLPVRGCTARRAARRPRGQPAARARDRGVPPRASRWRDPGRVCRAGGRPRGRSGGGRVARAAARHDDRAHDDRGVGEAERDPGGVRCDDRLPPPSGTEPGGGGRDHSRPGRRRRLRLENIERHGGTRSPIGGPLWEAVTSFVVAEEPGARVAPICVAGFADSPGCAMRSGASRTASSPRVRWMPPPLRG
jgi:hypothetical protein